jgi:hypothetical protein
MNVLTLVDESGFQCRVKAERALWYLESNGGGPLLAATFLQYGPRYVGRAESFKRAPSRASGFRKR